MRLDQYLNNNFDIQSRNKANELIKANKIKINGIVINKPSYKIHESDEIEILEDDFYVSRAAYKLKFFLDELPFIELKNKNSLDIGSSTGGFTQVLLENNVSKVTCVDVGTNQLHKRIKSNDKILFFEKTDIRKFESSDTYDIVTCDVSFISILHIINDINRLSSKDIIILFKPQFEVGTNVKRDKKGAVKDKKAVQRVRDNFLNYCISLKWKLKYSSISKLQGKDGNEEELFYFCK